jgi:hypothetical protein
MPSRIVPSWIVVAAALDDVHLVAPLRPVLAGVEGAADGIDGQSLLVAMAVAPDLGQRARLADERIVLGNASVIVQADDDAVMIRQVLRRMRFEVAGGRHLPVAHGYEHVAVRVEDDARPVVATTAGLGDEDLLDVEKGAVLETAARHRGCRIVTHRLGVAQVHETVGGEVGMQGDVEQAALALGEDLRHPGHGLGNERAVAHDAQAPRPFRDQHVAVRQPGHRPGDLEAVDRGDDAKVVVGGAMDLRLTGSGYGSEQQQQHGGGERRTRADH